MKSEEYAILKVLADDGVTGDLGASTSGMVILQDATLSDWCMVRRADVLALLARGEVAEAVDTAGWKSWRITDAGREALAAAERSVWTVTYKGVGVQWSVHTCAPTAKKAVERVLDEFKSGAVAVEGDYESGLV